MQAAKAINQARSSPESRLKTSIAPIHFPWLTEMRFFTAFAVLIHHIETTRNVMGLGPYPQGLIQVIGPNGVRVFFVLSGFLITHLLLSEVQRTGTVAVKKFLHQTSTANLAFVLCTAGGVISHAYCIFCCEG